MAFGSSTGYNNLAQGNFTPQIFSQKVQKFFRRASVVEDITNTDYAGEIENFGDTVKIINCLLYTSPSPRDLSTSRMPSSA